MNAHEFVADFGIEAVKHAIEEANAYGGDWIDTKTLEIKKHIPSSDSVFIGELKQVVESVGLVHAFDRGLVEAKEILNQINESGNRYARLFEKPALEKAIEDCELVESYKENQHV